MTNQFLIHKSSNAKDLELPKYHTPGSAGLDLRANVTESQTLDPGEFITIPVGIHISIPPGFEAQIRPRSGLAAKFGITVLNSPGTIDSDYRGEIKVPLINHGRERFEINRGLRIAQMVISPICTPNFIEVDELDSTERGEGGFGHTKLN